MKALEILSDERNHHLDIFKQNKELGNPNGDSYIVLLNKAIKELEALQNENKSLVKTLEKMIESKKAIQELTQVISEPVGKKMNDLIESIKTTSEYSKYIQAKKDLKDVLIGGKDYHSCSFMDISIRDDIFEAREKELIECIGIFILNKIEEEDIKDEKNYC